MATTYQPTQWLMPKNANQDKVGNYSFDFDGATDGISMAAPTNNNAGDISWSIWVYPTSFAAYNYFIDSGAVSINERGIFAGFEGTTGYLALNRRQSGTDKRCLTGFVDVGATINNWHHIVGVYDEDGGTAGVGQLKMYVNGVLKHTEDGSGTDLNDTTTLYIGQIYSGLPAYRFLGKISEVSIFNYPLTDGTVDPADNQIADLYGSAGAGVGNPMGLDPVPVGYWKGDKAALGAQWAVPNQVSKDYVFNFDGSDDRIDLPSSIDLGINSTISLWVNMDNGFASCFIGEASYTSDYLMYGSDNVSFHFQIGSYAPNFTTMYQNLTDSVWHNIVMVRTGDSVEAFLDGVSKATVVGYGTGTNTLFDRIGADSRTGGGAFLEGKISNVAAWDSSLTSGNITTIFNNGTPGDLTSLSPVSWWKLDDSATFSTNWSIPDDGSASNTGTSSGMTQGNLVPDTVTRGTAMYSEYSFDFDGVGDYFDCGTSFNSSLELGDSFSFSAWVKFSAGASTRTILSNWDSTPKGFQLLVTSTEYIGLRFQEDATNYFTRASNVLAVDTWHHIVVTYDGSGVVGGMNMYINSSLDNFGSVFQGTVTDITSADQVRIGAEGTFMMNYVGNISNVAIWDSELSAANVLTIYNNGRPGDLTSLLPIAWWKLGEEAFSTDPAADPNGWTVPDQIGSNDATSSGNPDLVGEAPQSFANGLSVSMDIDDRIGESGFSDNNALSYNMDSETRTTDTAP